MSDLAPLPAEFVTRVASLTGAELAWGVAHGWLTAEAAVAVASAQYDQTPEEETALRDLALLLSVDLDQADGILERLEISDEPVERRARVWLYLALARLVETAAGDDLFERVDELYADFDYPPEMEPFVSYMPPPAGAPTGPDALRTRLRSWLDAAAAEYRRRN